MAQNLISCVVIRSSRILLPILVPKCSYTYIALPAEWIHTYSLRLIKIYHYRLETLHMRRSLIRLRSRRLQTLSKHTSLVLQAFHQDATCRAKHGSNLTDCALDKAGWRRAYTEWNWLMTQTVCAETSNPAAISLITVPRCPHRETSPTPSMKIWLNTFAILLLSSNRIGLTCQLCIRKKKKRGLVIEAKQYPLHTVCISSTLRGRSVIVELAIRWNHFYTLGLNQCGLPGWDGRERQMYPATVSKLHISTER